MRWIVFCLLGLTACGSTPSSISGPLEVFDWGCTLYVLEVSEDLKDDFRSEIRPGRRGSDCICMHTPGWPEEGHFCQLHPGFLGSAELDLLLRGAVKAPYGKSLVGIVTVTIVDGEEARLENTKIYAEFAASASG